MDSPAPVLVCGLGNPDRKYRKTRHNLGFMVVERFAAAHGNPMFREKFSALYAETSVAGRRVLMVMPQTYMNLSGDPVSRFLQFFKVKPADLFVICDDVNLPVGEFRIRPQGSDGGHRGLASIGGRIGRIDFPRFRIGIAGSDLVDTSDHVLSDFEAHEWKILDPRLDEAAAAVDEFLCGGVDAAMNKFNGKVDTPGAF